MIRRTLALSIAAIVVLGLAGESPIAAPSFYEGKALRIIVGLQGIALVGLSFPQVRQALWSVIASL